jgi:hypothetical protein
MTNKKTMVVTAADIKQGSQCDRYTCPISLAARRAFTHHKNVRVLTYWLMVGTLVISLPERATKFINNFDRGKKVRPFRFTVTF